jgi:hypothetical protein
MIRRINKLCLHFQQINVIIKPFHQTASANVNWLCGRFLMSQLETNYVDYIQAEEHLRDQP